MKELPVGVQSIKELISKNYVYVDKTDIIHELIRKSGYYFLARPRRFGKTLLVETLKAIFQGEKELFRDYHLGSTDYSWEKHPVIHLNLSQVETGSSQILEDELKYILVKIAHQHGKPALLSKDLSFPLTRGLIDLVEALSEENEVVILIDEYDKPLTDHLHEVKIAEANREVLTRFFDLLKGLYNHLRFVFITGVSKFSQATLFSGLNNLIDITLHPPYSTLLGYTEAEIQLFFHEHIIEVVKKRSESGASITEQQVLEEMREWYNGYRFSAEETTVYNPYSILNFLQQKDLEEYWFETGTTSFLVEKIKKYPLLTTELIGSSAKRSDLMNVESLKDIPLTILLWQTGYLTIQRYDQKSKTYYLNFPNKEVREAFFYSLLVQLQINSPIITAQSEKCKEELEGNNLVAFFESVNGFFAKVPYYLWSTAGEGLYHALLLMLMESIGIKVFPEVAAPKVATNAGQIDLVLDTPKALYIFACKLDIPPDVALSQIELKRYREKYSKGVKEIVDVRITFSPLTRAISKWKAIAYSPNGEKKGEQSATLPLPPEESPI